MSGPAEKKTGKRRIFETNSGFYVQEEIGVYMVSAMFTHMISSTAKPEWTTWKDVGKFDTLEKANKYLDRLVNPKFIVHRTEG